MVLLRTQYKPQALKETVQQRIYKQSLAILCQDCS